MSGRGKKFRGSKGGLRRKLRGEGKKSRMSTQAPCIIRVYSVPRPGEGEGTGEVRRKKGDQRKGVQAVGGSLNLALLDLMEIDESSREGREGKEEAGGGREPCPKGVPKGNKKC